MVVFILLIIYDTVIATLGLTHMTPQSNLTCLLERQWGQLYSKKDAEVIRRIQDRHQCCGLRNQNDRAWPFPDKRHSAKECAETFTRDQGCLGGWSKDAQVTAGLLLLVAAIVFLLKVSDMQLFQAPPAFQPETY